MFQSMLLVQEKVTKKHKKSRTPGLNPPPYLGLSPKCYQLFWSLPLRIIWTAPNKIFGLKHGIVYEMCCVSANLKEN